MKWGALVLATVVLIFSSAGPSAATVLLQGTADVRSTINGPNSILYSIELAGPAITMQVTLHGATFTKALLGDEADYPQLEAWDNDPNQVFQNNLEAAELGCNAVVGTSCANLYSGDTVILEPTTLTATLFTVPLDLFATPPNYAGWPESGWYGDIFSRQSGLDFFTTQPAPGATFGFVISTVPEPVDWIVLIFGMGMIGLALGRRHLEGRPSA